MGGKKGKLGLTLLSISLQSASNRLIYGLYLCPNSTQPPSEFSTLSGLSFLLNLFLTDLTETLYLLGFYACHSISNQVSLSISYRDGQTKCMIFA